MPAVLERCVEHVMGKGHEQSSAYAICRSSLGLLSDGSEDGSAIEIPDEEMRSRVEIAMQFQNTPVLVKEMVVCGPMGRFVNGKQKGVIGRRRLANLVDAFRKHRRQVPVFMLGEHPPDNDQEMPVGWVERLRMQGDLLVARVKLHGPGASAVGGDLIRGASIYTVRAKNYDGTPIGEVLKHLLLTNEPFYKDLNVAAASEGGEAAACVFTSLPLRKDLAMDDDPMDKEKKDEEMQEETKSVKCPNCGADVEVAMQDQPEMAALLAEKTRQNLELTAANENLKADVEKFKSPRAVEELKLQLKQEQRKNRANEVRRKVKRGVERGQFDRALVGDPDSGYDHESDEQVLSWFKASCFKDNLERLDIMLETMPEKRLHRTFRSGGVGSEDKEVAMTDQTKEQIRSLGHDPEKVVAAMKAKDATEYQKAIAASK